MDQPSVAELLASSCYDAISQQQNSLTDKSNYTAPISTFFLVGNWVSYGTISCIGSRADEKSVQPQKALLHVNQEILKWDS